jgi:hypothetical protein
MRLQHIEKQETRRRGKTLRSLQKIRKNVADVEVRQLQNRTTKNLLDFFHE